MNSQLIDIVTLSKDLLPVEDQGEFFLYCGDVLKYLHNLPANFMFDLVVSSPPYNLGKAYEERVGLEKYMEWQKEIIRLIVPHIKDSGSICWQVGNFVENGSIWPLDYEFAPFFRNELNLKLRNRIIWHFGHGLHTKKRFSGRYEVVLWFSKSDNYVFNLDDVRIEPKYPGKRYYKGPKAGQYSSNPKGKNPEDVWEIPNVKSNHIEKTIHPCQFPVGLIERLILSLTNEGDIVFDPFAGVASAGVAAAIHQRKFIGCDIVSDYLQIGKERITDALRGKAKYRPVTKPIYDPSQSPLSKRPKEFNEMKEEEL